MASGKAPAHTLESLRQAPRRERRSRSPVRPRFLGRNFVYREPHGLTEQVSTAFRAYVCGAICTGESNLRLSSFASGRVAVLGIAYGCLFVDPAGPCYGADQARFRRNGPRQGRRIECSPHSSNPGASTAQFGTRIPVLAACRGTPCFGFPLAHACTALHSGLASRPYLAMFLAS